MKTNKRHLKGSNILVTGGAGFIGSHLVDRLIKESPNKIVVIDNLFLGKKENLEYAKSIFSNLKCYWNDVANYDIVRKILENEKIDTVFNLAVIPLPTSLENPLFTTDVNVKTVNNLCDLLWKKYYKTLMHFSSSEVYGTAQYTPMDEKHPLIPLTPYAASKAAGDHIVLSFHKTFNLDVVIVRPFNNYGPRQNMGDYAGIIPVVMKKIANNQEIIIHGDGKQTRDFIYVGDTVNAVVDIYKEPSTQGKAINIASGLETSINSLVNTLIKLTKSKVKIIYDNKRPGDVDRHCGAMNLAKKLIRFRLSTNLNKGLTTTINWYNNAIKNEK